MSKKITLLGSTGSIGTQSLDVIRAQGYEVFGLSAHSHVEKILEQIEEFHPRYVCMTDPDAAARLDAALAGRANAPRLLTGPEGLKELAAMDGPDVVLNSVVGIAGLGTSLTAIESGHDLALANKESLVTGGHLVTQAVAKHGVKLLPVEEYGYDAVFFILLILCFAWGGDTCAYFAGRAFGKHKLCPVVSPKKTVEGAIGGVLGTMVFGVAATLIYSIAADRMEAFTRSNIGVSMYVVIALLACVAAVLGIYGDLFASVVKRQCGIKDYGTIFPGHGGILDRFDSVMFIAPFVTMVITAVFYR